MTGSTPSTPTDAIVLDHVDKSYGNKRAVIDLSLRVREGELFAFLGPNGAGKTTTIKMIAGLLRPNSGTIHVCGHPMSADGVAAKAELAYVPDQPFLYDKLSGREFLYFVAEMYGVPPAKRDASLAALEPSLDLEPFLDRLTEQYSHGMKQRVVLAAALLHDPQVLMIDEPMVGLDPRTVRMVKELFLERVRRGRTVFMSTHTLSVAEAIADRIGIIRKGKLVSAGTLEELHAKAEREQTLEELFLQLTREEETLVHE